MPRFSVIVPVYKVQAYLHACLESVLEQSCSDFEVIAVDDCSPDASGAIADEFAAPDERVRTVHLPENVGLGRARNAGLEHATGDYVLFLDSDDTLTPGALQAITDRIEATGGPDVLVYDYARTYWTGEAVRNQYADRLAQDGPAPFALADRPEILQLLMVAWNKAYRRAFVEEQGLTFPPGYYEDTPWTYPVLMSARTIATLDRVCVHYRQRRRRQHPGHHQSREHFDVFDQYDRVFAFLDAHPELGRAGARCCSAGWSTTSPRCSRTRTGCRAAPGPTSCAGPARTTGVTASPARPSPPATGSGTAWCGSARTARTGRWPRRCAACGGPGGSRAGCGKRPRAAALQAHYRVQLRLPVRADRAVFSSYWGRGYGCNPGALEAAFRTYAPHVATAWVAEPEHHHTLPSGTRALRPGTAAYWTALARSKYLVNNVNFDHRLVKRAGQVVIQTQHGTPLKKMGLDLQDRPAAARGQDFGRLLRSVDTLGLRPVRQPALHPRVGARLPVRVHDAGVRVSAQRRFHRATPRDVARVRESARHPRGRHGDPVRADPPRLPPHPALRPRPGAGAAPARHGLRRPDPRPPASPGASRAERRRASSTSPATRASSRSVWRRTPSSPTTRP